MENLNVFFSDRVNAKYIIANVKCVNHHLWHLTILFRIVSEGKSGENKSMVHLDTALLSVNTARGCG